MLQQKDPGSSAAGAWWGTPDTLLTDAQVGERPADRRRRTRHFGQIRSAGHAIGGRGQHTVDGCLIRRVGGREGALHGGPFDRALNDLHVRLRAGVSRFAAQIADAGHDDRHEDEDYADDSDQLHQGETLGLSVAEFLQFHFVVRRRPKASDIRTGQRLHQRISSRQGSLCPSLAGRPTVPF